MGNKTLTAEEALQALNALRSNVVATQSATWSNMMYPVVAILDAAGLEQYESSQEQMAEHFDCYGGAGGYPGNQLSSPDITAKNSARRIVRNRKDSSGEV